MQTELARFPALTYEATQRLILPILSDMAEGIGSNLDVVTYSMARGFPPNGIVEPVGVLVAPTGGLAVRRYRPIGIQITEMSGVRETIPVLADGDTLVGDVFPALLQFCESVPADEGIDLHRVVQFGHHVGYLILRYP